MTLRRQRLTGAQIACDLAVSPATVSRVLRWYGPSRMRDLEPPMPVQRYELDKPGELIDIDIKLCVVPRVERTARECCRPSP